MNSCWCSIVVAALAGAMAGGCSFNPKRETPSGGGGGGGAGPGTGGGGSGTIGIDGLTALQISPSSATLSVTEGGPAVTQQYTVTGTIAGEMRDLTSRVTYSVTPGGIVTISPNGLVTTTGSAGGRVTIIASSGSVSAHATLAVNYSFTGADPGAAGSGVPPDAATIVSGAPADPTRPARRSWSTRTTACCSRRT